MNEVRLPKRVDAVKLVDNNQLLSGEIEGGSLERLNDAVVSHNAAVNVSLEFSRDQERHRVAQGQCSTKVSMTCQRCLNEVEVSISSQFELGFVYDDEQAKQLPRRLEPVELDENGQADLWELIEDEVLLNLPDFPMHPPGACQLFKPESQETANEDVEKPNPFDILKQLKQK